MAWDGHRGECRDFMLQTSPLHPQLTVRTCTQRGTLALWGTKTLRGCDAPPGVAFPCHCKALSCHPTICRGRVTLLGQNPDLSTKGIWGSGCPLRVHPSEAPPPAPWQCHPLPSTPLKLDGRFLLIGYKLLSCWPKRSPAPLARN